MIPRKWPSRRTAANVYAKSGVKAAIAREIEMKKELAKRRYQDPSEIAYLYVSGVSKLLHLHNG